MLTPGQIERICDACARWDADGPRVAGIACGTGCCGRCWRRAGMRLGEALGLQHRDWHTGCGDTPFIEVVPREHPHGVRVKGGGYRKLYVSAELDRLYGEYVWQLCDAGADLAVG